MEGRLVIETAPVSQPKPTACWFLVGDQKIGWVSIEELKRAAAHVERLEAARRA